LLELLKPDNAPQLPAAWWSPIHCALAEGLIDRDGILAFGHDYLRQAVGQRYLPDPVPQKDTRIELADYFAAQPITARSCDELPWLLRKAEQRDRLSRCLLDIERFLLILDRDENELLEDWVWLQQERSMGQNYLESFTRWEHSTGLTAHHPRYGSVAHQVGYFLDRAGLYAAAEPLSRRALESSEQVLGLEHPLTLSSVNNLALLLHSKGDLAAAEPLTRRALESSEQVLGPEHSFTLICVNNLATLLQAKGDLAAAKPLYRRALESSERVRGSEDPHTVTIVNNLAGLLYSKGDFAAAEPLARRAVKARECVLGPEHPDTLISISNLAMLLNAQGDLAAAERLDRWVLESRERVLGPAHPDTLRSLHSLAVLLCARGDLTAAESLLWQVLAGLIAISRANGRAHLNLQTAANNYTRLLQQLGRSELEIRAMLHEFAPDFFGEPAGSAEVKRQEITPEQARELALKWYKAGQYEGARALLEQLLEIGYEVLSTRLHLARIALLTDDLAAAQAHVAEAWTQRAEAQPYVVGRILWFQVAFALLHGASPAPFLGRLKTALQAEGAHMDWTMDPVLAHLQPKLSPEAHALLTALVAALSDPANLAKLDNHPEWRAATPLPLA